MSFFSYTANGAPDRPVEYIPIKRNRNIYGDVDNIPTRAMFMRIFREHDFGSTGGNHLQ